MPANKKHLLKTRLGRTSKVLAAIVGCMFAAMGIHLVLAYWIGFEHIIPTMSFSLFIVWVGLMLLIYWIKKPWKGWLLLLAVIMVSMIGIVLEKS